MNTTAYQWKKKLLSPKYLTENQIRRLLDYCELPFHEACLAFHKTRRQVKTPSASQVQQPINEGSKGRWKNYEKHLEPLRTALQIK